MLFEIIKYAGVTYLFYLGIAMLTSTRYGLSASINQANDTERSFILDLVKFS